MAKSPVNCIICFFLNYQIVPKGYHAQGAGGSIDGLLLLHLDYGKEWFQRGLMEELLMHEASHACLDEHHKTVSILVYIQFTLQHVS